MADIDFTSIFKEQAAGQIKRITALALTLEETGEGERPDDDVLKDLMREFHTLKGAARAVQYLDIKDTAHAIEDVYHAILEDDAPIRLPLLTDLSLYAVDIVETLLQARIDGVASTAHEGLAGLVQGYLDGEAVSISKKGGAGPNDGDNAADEEPNDAGATAQIVSGGDTSQYEELTDSLMDVSGQFAVAIDTAEGNRAAMRRVSGSVASLKNEIGSLLSSLNEQLLEAGFDTTVDALTHYRDGLHKLERTQDELTDHMEHENAQLRFLSEDLSRQVNRARLVPLSLLFEGYRRQARDLSKELGKDCAVKTIGGNTRIDRGVLNGVRAPMNHILRNAIDHGIETPEERSKMGKPTQGTVTINATTLGGGQVQITIKDDGRGMCMDALRARAVAGRHTTEEIWNELSDHERIQFLFLPGFSTAQTVSETSGRGFGLDIVKTEIEAIGGRVSLEFEEGAGTTITLHLPLNLALMRCLLVEVGGHPFFGTQHVMFPLNEVEQVIQIDRNAFRKIEGREAVHINGETVPVHDMSAVMALKTGRKPIEEKHMIVLGNDEQRHALVVERIIDERNIVSRPFDSRLGKMHNFHSSALMQDGSVALLVDVNDLLLYFEDHRSSGVMSAAPANGEGGEDKKTQTHVLVVEDSATVREVERHMLEEAGYKVTTAVNGVDALNKLRGVSCDLVITDIDMPVMNGIELITKIRSHERLSGVPIIVVSYKDRDKDRATAIDAGADHYLTKGAFDSNMAMELIAETVAG